MITELQVTRVTPKIRAMSLLTNYEIQTNIELGVVKKNCDYLSSQMLLILECK